MAKQHNLSLTLFTVSASPLPYEEKLKKVREIGYQSIQGGVAQGMTNKEHKDLLDSLGIEMSCFGGNFEEMGKYPQRYAEDALYFDCDEIMIGTMPTECRKDYDGYMRGIDRINEVGRALYKYGVYLSYHNHAQEFRRFKDGKRGIDLLFENLDPNGVRFLLDTHWLQAGGADILEWMDKCKGRIKNLHVKDYRIAPANYFTGIGEADKQFSQVGDGQLPWQLIIDKGLEIGIQAFIVEQDKTYDEDPFDCAAQSYATLKACGLY
jgi:sugar phosphate isomerase/epimerase